MAKDENCNIYYHDLMDFLDFKTRPVYNLTDSDYEKVVRHAPPLKYTEVRTENLTLIIIINYVTLLFLFFLYV